MSTATAPGGLPARTTVCIVGAGPGGIASGRAVRRAGIDDFVIVDRQAGFGGTWRQNDYPGAACDISSYFYSFSFARRRRWSAMYASQPELLEYFETVADQLGLRPHFMGGCGVESMIWDEQSGEWHVSTTLGTITARYVIGAVGIFSEPSLPAIPGRTDFAGPLFHSSTWDHDADLTGTVAVVGTGASSVQIVPELARRAERVLVYQRQPGWVVPKADESVSARRRWMYRNVPGAGLAYRWKLWLRTERAGLHRTDAPALDRLTAAALAHLRTNVPDEALRASLTPDHVVGCTRRLPSNRWYGALQLPNVELITEPVTRLTRSEVVSPSGARRADAVVMATGFQATKFLRSIKVHGRGGESLDAAWRDGATAHLGVTVAGFPNLFMLYGPYSNGTASAIHVHEAQARFIGLVLRRARRRGYAEVEVTQDAYAAFERTMQSAMADTVWTQSCRSYFLDEHGTVRTQFPFRFARYWLMTWRVRPRDFHWRRRGAAELSGLGAARHGEHAGSRK